MTKKIKSPFLNKNEREDIEREQKIKNFFDSIGIDEVILVYVNKNKNLSILSRKLCECVFEPLIEQHQKDHE